jgi:hypothetical protein
VTRRSGEKTSIRPVGHCPTNMYGDYRRIVMMGDGGTVTGIARPRRAVKPQSRFCGAPQARGLTAKARTERSSCRRNACRRRTLSERLSTDSTATTWPGTSPKRMCSVQGFGQRLWPEPISSPSAAGGRRLLDRRCLRPGGIDGDLGVRPIGQCRTDYTREAAKALWLTASALLQGTRSDRQT